MHWHFTIAVRASTAAVGCLFAAAWSAPASAQTADERAPVFDFMRQSMAEYSMLAVGDPEVSLTLLDEPVYHWTVQISGRNDGALFLWLNGRRPEIVGCVVTRPAKRIYYHEFHSLSPAAVAVVRQQQKAWHPDGPGLQLQDLPDAVAPAANSVRRRIEMRSLARKFSVSVVHQKDGARWDTRMLARPVYEYSEGDVRDGGLFLFVRANDPQLLLVLEARRGEHGDRWQYGVARLASNEIAVTYEHRNVQTIPIWKWRFEPTDVRPRNEPYAQFEMGTYPAAAAEEAGRVSTDAR
jgi:hypothetical protein